MKTKKAFLRTTIAILLILVLISLIAFGFIKNYGDQIKQKDCIEEGSFQHEVAYFSDLPLAIWIKNNGEELGPHFDYKFC